MCSTGVYRAKRLKKRISAASASLFFLDILRAKFPLPYIRIAAGITLQNLICVSFAVISYGFLFTVPRYAEIWTGSAQDHCRSHVSIYYNSVSLYIRKII
jgi:hypothetical protein